MYTLRNTVLYSHTIEVKLYVAKAYAEAADKRDVL